MSSTILVLHNAAYEGPVCFRLDNCVSVPTAGKANKDDWVTQSNEQRLIIAWGSVSVEYSYSVKADINLFTSPAHESVGNRPVRTFMSTDFPELEGPRTAVMPPGPSNRRQHVKRTVYELA